MTINVSYAKKNDNTLNIKCITYQERSTDWDVQLKISTATHCGNFPGYCWFFAVDYVQTQCLVLPFATNIYII